MAQILDFFNCVRRADFSTLDPAYSNNRLKIGKCSPGRIAQFEQSILIPQIGPGFGINHESCHRRTSENGKQRTVAPTLAYFTILAADVQSKSPWSSIFRLEYFYAR